MCYFYTYVFYLRGGVVGKQFLGRCDVIMRNKSCTTIYWCRPTILTICVVWLSGCVSIPPILEQASWLLSGGSYLATGKGPSDHAISIVTKKDCSLLRLMILKPICVPVTEETEQSSLSQIYEKSNNSPIDPDIHVKHRINYVDPRIARIKHRIGAK